MGKKGKKPSAKPGGAKAAAAATRSDADAGPQPRRFSEFPEISAETVSILTRLGFQRATPVQEATLPLFCGNKDVAVDACTGSGKTLAFVVPAVEKLRRLKEKLKKHQVGAIIISPTRELSAQIFKVGGPFFDSLPGVTARLLVGGTDPAADVALLREGGQVLVGTPGRINDIMRRASFLSFKALEVLVLDEADRLLDMGFQRQLDAIMAALPKQRRTGLFSATQTEAVEALTRAGLRNPVRIAVSVAAAGTGADVAGTGADMAAQPAAAAVAQQRTPSTLKIVYEVCEAHAKVGRLVDFLARHADKKVIVYFMTCASVDYFAAVLPRLKQLQKVNLCALHGRMKQAARETALGGFAKQDAGAILCTDVAARGLDIPDVDWIVQYDPPQDPSAFVHRVGRTARMGRSGNAIFYLLPNETSYVEFLAIRKVPVEEQPSEEGNVDVLGTLLKQSETDRDAMEKSVKAFISYVRGYKEHQCKFIFRFAELNLGSVAKSFSLLSLPRMPEVKKSKSLEAFVKSQVDPETVKYKDKAREKQRQANLKKQAAAEAAKAEEEAKADAKRKVESAKDASKKLPAAKRRLLQERADMDDLMSEYTLLKRVKKGKMSNHEFDVATGLESASDDDDGAQGRGAKNQVAGKARKKGGMKSAKRLKS